MSRHKSFATVLALLMGEEASHSRHRAARVQRFIYRHRDAHQKIIGQLRRREQKRRRFTARLWDKGVRT